MLQGSGVRGAYAFAEPKLLVITLYTFDYFHCTTDMFACQSGYAPIIIQQPGFYKFTYEVYFPDAGAQEQVSIQIGHGGLTTLFRSTAIATVPGQVVQSTVQYIAANSSVSLSVSPVPVNVRGVTLSVEKVE